MSRCLLLALCGGMLFTGCTKPAAPRAAAGAAAEGKKFLLAEEPAGAIGVKQAKTDSKDADEVTLVGRIGGAEDPWVKGQAAFTIVDTALKPCNEQDDDDCPKPWDYCCDTDALPANKALIKLVDASGKTIAGGRIAVGAVAPTPLYAAEASDFLKGKPATEDTSRQAGELARKIAKPISDMRGPAEYRVHLVGVLVARSLSNAAERANS